MSVGENFHSAAVKQGMPLGMIAYTTTLTADDTIIDPTGYSLILLGSNNTTAANRTFSLRFSPVIGHELAIIFTSGSSTKAELANSGIMKLSSTWTPSAQYNMIQLVSDGTSWIEVARGPSSLGLTLTDAHILVGNSAGVGTDVAVSGDVTIANTGAVTIANSAITNAKVDAAAAIAYSKLATLTSGNVLVGSAGNVATSVAMAGDVTIVAAGTTTIGAAKVTIAKLDPAVMLEATGTLTQANITGMNGTPVELIAAPAAGKIHIVIDIELLHAYSTTVYANGGDVSIEYGDGSDIVLIDSTIVTNNSSTNRYIRPSAYDLDATTGTGIGYAITPAIAQNIRVTNATAAFINGNAANQIRWRIRYYTVTAIV